MELTTEEILALKKAEWRLNNWLTGRWVIAPLSALFWLASVFQYIDNDSASTLSFTIFLITIFNWNGARDSLLLMRIARRAASTGETGS